MVLLQCWRPELRRWRDIRFWVNAVLFQHIAQARDLGAEGLDCVSHRIHPPTRAGGAMRGGGIKYGFDGVLRDTAR